MTSRIEILKQRSIQSTIGLVQDRLTDDLVAELIEALPELKEYSILSAPVTTKAELKALVDLVKEFKQRLPSALREDLRDELTEIREDLNWMLSQEGKAILELESWVQVARSELNDLRTVFIGRSWKDPMVLIVNGVVTYEEERERVVKRIEVLQPPVKPTYAIELESDELDRQLN